MEPSSHFNVNNLGRLSVLWEDFQLQWVCLTLFQAINIQFVQRAPLLPLAAGKLASTALNMTGPQRCKGAEVGVSCSRTQRDLNS